MAYMINETTEGKLVPHRINITNGEGLDTGKGIAGFSCSVRNLETGEVNQMATRNFAIEIDAYKDKIYNNVSFEMVMSYLGALFDDVMENGIIELQAKEEEIQNNDE